MSIIRVKKDINFTTVANAPFNDARLSWGARGVMAYLLTKPDNWTVNIRDLEKRGPSGNAAMRRILAELRLYGYLKQHRERNVDGTFIWVSEVYEIPPLPCVENPHVDEPQVDKSLLIKTELTKTDTNKPAHEKTNSASSRGNGSGKSAREVILEKRGGKSEKTVEQAANEKVDKIIELNTPPEKKKAALKIREIFEAETGLNIGDQWENKRSRWYLFDEWLLDKFIAGQEIGVFLDWYFTTHNKNKQRKEVAGFLSPDLIKTRWNLAFMPDEVEVDNTTLIMQQHTKIY